VIRIKITKDTTILEVVKKHPETVEVFQKHGLSCVGCPFAMMETLEQGAKSHGIDLEKLLKDLNDAVKEE
jgi:hybrid cluster-associated redox disulfide protein